MHELGHTRAIHFSVKSRWQRWFHRSRELGLRHLTKSLIYSLLSIQVSFQLRNLILHVLQQLHLLLSIGRGLSSHIDIFMVRGGYCNVTQDSPTHRTPKHAQNQNNTPETKCKVLKLTLCNYTQPN